MGVKGIAADGTVITDDRVPSYTAKVDSQGGLQTQTAAMSPAGREQIARSDEGGALVLSQDATLLAILAELRTLSRVVAQLALAEGDLEMIRYENLRDVELN